MRGFKASILGFLALVSVPSFARAAGGFSVGVEGGVMEFDSRASLGEAGVAWGLRAGFGLLGPARLEARFLSAGHDLAGNAVHVRQGSALLHFDFLRARRLNPYAFGGVGMRMSSTDMPGQASDSAIIVPFGAGVDLRLGDHILMAPEFTWHHRASSGSTDMPAAAGDTFSLALVLKFEV